LLSGIALELVGESLDERRFPQQGKSIDLGPEFGHLRLNLDCDGPSDSSRPTVILDSGLGLPAYSWQLVQSRVAGFARVCSYDRAGYGWSEAGSTPRTSLEIAKELHALLRASGEKPPFLLVGHSFGGFNVRVFTGLYPGDVVGMVLVDAAHEDRISRMPPAMRALTKPPGGLSINLSKIELHLGILRLREMIQNWHGGVHDEFQQRLRLLDLRSKAMDAFIEELRSFDQSAEQVRAAGNLGDRPLIVLTAGIDASSGKLPVGITQKDIDEQRRIWVDELQVREMRLSTRGKRLLVTDSGHMIPFQRPDIVAAAIREVWQAAPLLPNADTI
jgi:pimeloyl-ACP methyl ester carboxylesterase